MDAVMADMDEMIAAAEQQQQQQPPGLWAGPPTSQQPSPCAATCSAVRGAARHAHAARAAWA
jgi:hypothetical protein